MERRDHRTGTCPRDLQPGSHPRRDALHPRPGRPDRPDSQAALRRGIWRPPGGGIKPGEDFAVGAEREALEETGLAARLERYLVATHASFSSSSQTLEWRTHVFLARTTDTALAPLDTEEIAGARWGTLDELGGPLRERLLATGHALWRYRVALHDAALRALRE